MIAYVILLRLISSHCTLYILSSRFMMLKNVFCLILRFFLASGGEGTWWNIALLNETQSPQQLQQVLLEPRCRTKWTNTKDTEKG